MNGFESFHVRVNWGILLNTDLVIKKCFVKDWSQLTCLMRHDIDVSILHNSGSQMLSCFRNT